MNGKKKNKLFLAKLIPSFANIKKKRNETKKLKISNANV